MGAMGRADEAEAMAAARAASAACWACKSTSLTSKLPACLYKSCERAADSENKGLRVAGRGSYGGSRASPCLPDPKGASQ
jgi:hypothetical protein